MNYDQAVMYIQDLCKFGINLGMDRIRSLLALIGHPEQGMPCIHIAGTNGKGSTSMLIAAVLQAGGYRVGAYTSPHLQSYTERFAINGQPISEQDFARLVTRMQSYVEQVITDTQEHPTEFELLTAMAFLYFREQQVDYVVLEVGLGGTLDSTNVITPCVSIITNIGFDHADRLGSTIKEIAANKAGIIKTGVPVITAATGEGLEVIARVAELNDAPLINVRRDYIWTAIETTPAGQTFFIQTPYKKYDNLHIKLLGPHQMENSAIALAALEKLSADSLLIDDQAILQGFANARWPGRFEVISEVPVVILDGAHNIDGAKALRATLEVVFPEAEIVLVVGILADKDYSMMLCEFAAVADLIIASTADSPRAADPFKIASAVNGCEVTVIPDLQEAVAAGIRQAGMGKIVCICGSLYTVGKAREILRAKK